MSSTDPLLRRVENYRESCDNCAKSKVRCGKEQPWCQRCERRGQVCSYSPSQRSRKRTLDTTHPEGDQRNGTPPFTAISSAASVAAVSNGFSTLLSHADGWGSCPDLVELFTSGSSSESLTPDNTNLVWLSDMESIAGDASAGKSMERMDSFAYSKGNAMGALSAAGMGSGSGSGAGTDAAGQRSRCSVTDRQHCEADLISALAKPDLPSLSCWGNPKDSQNLGTILTASRATLKCVTTAMSCTCTPNDNVALLATAVLLRILSWYHIVLKNCRGPNDGSAATIDDHNSPAPSNDGKDTERSLSRDTDVSQDRSEQSSLIMPPMTIGAYELDSENRERMIGHIMLSELSKMGNLLSDFSKKFCDPQSTTLGNDNRSQLFLALEMLIRNKHMATVLDVRKKLEVK
ncbi:aurr1 aurofusarin regulatory [Fusarium sporotrichioides]|uniref:Aurr1 aurofusarin regulatory n=1 Tax=Fusarium sporotrichioides TaxID=5514 RepID=A0A395S151_FUSSP|nr:aurr1 aurofusarin regulatory [Fusarium sporotrichioides]